LHGKFFPSRHGGERGFTLIESLVVTIVGIIILAASAAGVGKLTRDSNIATEMSNIAQIGANLRNIKGASDGYKNLNNELAKKFKVIPANMVGKDGAIVNAWGGEVIFGSRDGRYKMDYLGVPAGACEQFVLKLRKAGWLWFDVDEVSNMDTKTLSLAEIAHMCNKKNDRKDGHRIRIEGN